MRTADIYQTTRTPVDTLETMGREGDFITLLSPPYDFKGDFETANRFLRMKRIEDISNERVWTVIIKPQFNFKNKQTLSTHEFNKKTNIWTVKKTGKKTKYKKTSEVIIIKDPLNVDDLYTVEL